MLRHSILDHSSCGLQGESGINAELCSRTIRGFTGWVQFRSERGTMDVDIPIGPDVQCDGGGYLAQIRDVHVSVDHDHLLNVNITCQQCLDDALWLRIVFLFDSHKGGQRHQRRRARPRADDAPFPGRAMTGARRDH